MKTKSSKRTYKVCAGVLVLLAFALAPSLNAHYNGLQYIGWANTNCRGAYVVTASDLQHFGPSILSYIDSHNPQHGCQLMNP
ncbi:hypothetical protein [Candidatus Foliamicus sp.]